MKGWYDRLKIKKNHKLVDFFLFPGTIYEMKHEITYRQTFITDCSESNTDFNLLYHIFAPTLKPGMDFREFKRYYMSAKLEYIDVTFILLNKIIIGFCAAAFYNTGINNKKYTIGRAATGILQQYRGHTLPKWKLYKKYIWYWCKHPFSNIILSAYVANPLIYAMICKYTGIAYPRPGCKPPDDIIDIKNELLKSQNLHRKEGTPFVVEIHFCVEIAEKEQERIFTSKDGAVKYFLYINPAFMHQHGVVVIIPITLKNILFSSFKFLYYSSAKAFNKSIDLFKINKTKNRK